MERERLQQLVGWLRRNADKRGTPEFERALRLAQKLREGLKAASTVKEKPGLLGGVWDAALSIPEALIDIGQRVDSAIRGVPYKPYEEQPGWFDEARRFLRDSKTGYEPETSWEDVKREGLTFSGVRKALKFGAETAAQSLPHMALSMVPVAGLPAVAATIADQTVNQREALTGKPAGASDYAIAAGTGLASAALERIGAQRVLGKVLGAGKGAAGRTARAALAEGTTEAVQSPLEYAGATAGTDFFDPSELGNQAAAGFVGGAVAGGGIRGTLEAPGVVARSAKTAVNLPAKVREELRYRASPEVVESDLRVAKMFERMWEEVKAREPDREPEPSVIFKNIHDHIKGRLTAALRQLRKNGQITPEVYDDLVKVADAPLQQAAKHNRELLESTLDRVRSLGLEPEIEQGLVRAFLDLDTASRAGLKRRGEGPMARTLGATARAYGSIKGWATGGPLGGVAGGDVAGAVGKALGAKLDRLLGLAEPPELRRIRKTKELLGDKVDAGDTDAFLAELQDRAKRAQTASEREAADEAIRLYRAAKDARAQRRLRNVPGLGGFDAYIYEHTGLRPAEVDKGLLKLLLKGDIGQEVFDDFLDDPHRLMKGRRGLVLVDLLDNLAERGELERDPSWVAGKQRAQPVQPAPPEGSSYRSIVDTANRLRDLAMENAPVPPLKVLAGQIAATKNREGKTELYQQALERFPEHREFVETYLKPLTEFGPSKGRQDGRLATLLTVPAALARKAAQAKSPAKKKALQPTKALWLAQEVIPLGDELPPLLRLQRSPEAAREFHRAISEARQTQETGTQVHVYSPEEYEGMRLYLAPDGSFGAAIKSDGDIVSVFKRGDAPHRGVVQRMLPILVQEGGRKLDAFATYLPQLYARSGFRPVARLAFNDEFAPEGWDYEYYKRFHPTGRPPIVFSVYDPNFDPATFDLDAIPEVSDYDEAVARQTEALERLHPVQQLAERALKAGRHKPDVLDASRSLGHLLYSGKAKPRQRYKAEVREAAQLIERYARSTGAPIDPKDYSEEARERIARLMANDFLEAARRGDSAYEWYREDIQKALDGLGELYPETKVDPVSRHALLVALAITSQGLRVEDNIRVGAQAYEVFRRTGRFPEEAGMGKGIPLISANFKLLNRMIEKDGIEAVVDFLNRQTTVRELRQMGFDVNGESPDTVVYGSMVLGPKIGSFYQNLAGNFDTITFDLWWMRAWGRWLGHIMQKVSPEERRKRLERLRGAVNPELVQKFLGSRRDPAELDEKDLTRLAHQIFAKAKENGWYRDAEGRTPEWLRAARSVKEMSEPMDQPYGPRHRAFMRSVVRRAQEMLAPDVGYVPGAALQATLWFPEKQLYEKFGVNTGYGSAAQSYSKAVKDLLRIRSGADARALGVPGMEPGGRDAAGSRLAEVRAGPTAVGPAPGGPRGPERAPVPQTGTGPLRIAEGAPPVTDVQLLGAARKFLPAGVLEVPVDSPDMGGAAGLFDPRVGQMLIGSDLRPEQRYPTVAHEFGHAVDYGTGWKLSQVAQQYLGELQANSRRRRPRYWEDPEGVARELGASVEAVRAYQTDPRELVADAVTTYIFDPSVAKKIMPGFTKVLQDLVKKSPKLASLIEFASVGGLIGASMAKAAVDEVLRALSGEEPPEEA